MIDWEKHNKKVMALPKHVAGGWPIIIPEGFANKIVELGEYEKYRSYFVVSLNLKAIDHSHE